MKMNTEQVQSQDGSCHSDMFKWKLNEFCLVEDDARYYSIVIVIMMLISLSIALRMLFQAREKKRKIT